MQCDSTIVALGLTMYRRQHGSWPTSLEQLVPDFLPSVPLDRFDGKPMKYRLKDGKPIVYSVGPEMAAVGQQMGAELDRGFKYVDGDWTLWPIRTVEK